MFISSSPQGISFTKRDATAYLVSPFTILLLAQVRVRFSIALVIPT